MFDLKIINGNCFIGNKLLQKNIYVNGEKIALLSKKDYPAKETADAKGLIVSAGFIDSHSHSDLEIFKGDRNLAKISQGVTTEIAGNCGLNAFNINPEKEKGYFNTYKGIFGEAPPLCWKSFNDYKKLIKNKLISNTAFLSSYGSLRKRATGLIARPLNAEELAGVKKEIKEEFKGGTIGLSFGMSYPPNSFADDKEIKNILKFISNYKNKIAAVHLWDEGNYVLESAERFLELAKGRSLKVEISHYKAYGKNNWKKMYALLNLIERYRKKGTDVEFDFYPYTAGSTTACALLPPFVFNDSEDVWLKKLSNKKFVGALKKYFYEGISGWENYFGIVGAENIKLINLKYYKKYEGLSLSQIASRLKKDEVETVCEVIRKEKGAAAMLMFAMSEKNIIKKMKNKYSKIGSDGLYGGKPHPRTYGSFIHFLKWAIQKKVLTITQALYKITLQPARFFNLKERGILKKGFYADIVLLDLKKMSSPSYEDSTKLCGGVKRVFVNGKTAYDGIEKKVININGKILGGKNEF